MHSAYTASILIATSVCTSSAFAVDYLSAEQARALLFPAAAQWQNKRFALSPEQVQTLGKLAGVPARSAAWALSQALDDKGKYLGSVVVDQVIGKFELITYAVGIDAKGAVTGIEILSYRESHGGEIRLPAWRKQFAGKTLAQPIKVGDDVALISGATLSCSHVTDGVRRSVGLFAMLREGGLLPATGTT